MSLARSAPTGASIEVVPRRCWRRPDGATVSFYGAAPHPSEGYEAVTEGFTWRRIDRLGRCTIGLCRAPATTREEADAVAAAFAVRTGARVIGGAR